MMARKRASGTALGAFVLVLSVLYVLPFLFLVMNSFKPYGEVVASFLQLPKKFTLGNYSRVWGLLDFPVVLKNTVLLCVASVVGAVFVSSLAGYKLQRFGGRLSRVIYFYFIFSMLIPFYVIMIPVVQTATAFHLNNSLIGLWVLYTTFHAPFGIFIFYGFTKSVPLEIEEAAIIDGCNPFTLFFRVVLPLLQPAVATLAVLFMLWTWNDFLLPFLLINSRPLRTLTLSFYSFIGLFRIEWENFITSVVMSAAPIVVFYFFTQKYIHKGIAAGAIK
jgi:raffinose/stachyose/melibiose transport system permease protein